jgi:hypothetical protein
MEDDQHDMSSGDAASDECDLPYFMLEALREGRSDEGYASTILNKRSSLFYQPPNPILAYGSSDPDAANWLPDVPNEILESDALKVGDIDDKGMPDPKKLEAAMYKVFQAVPKFCNMYQLKQFSIRFGERWGFRVATHATRQLVCCFASPAKQAYVSQVSPNKATVETSQPEGHDAPCTDINP